MAAAKGLAAARLQCMDPLYACPSAKQLPRGQRGRRRRPTTRVAAEDEAFEDDGWPTEAELAAAPDGMRGSAPAEMTAAGERGDQGAAAAGMSGKLTERARGSQLHTSVGEPPRPSFQPPQYLQGSPLAGTGGFIWSLALLATIRLTRWHTEMSPFSSHTRVRHIRPTSLQISISLSYPSFNNTRTWITL